MNAILDPPQLHDPRFTGRPMDALKSYLQRVPPKVSFHVYVSKEWRRW